MIEPMVTNTANTASKLQRKIRVLVVDDVMSIRLLLSKIINTEKDMEVVGMAEHPLEAGEKLRALTPDVMTLDVEMPHMSGLTFLEKIMRLRPLPVVMISTRTEKGSEDAIRALEAGAVEVIRKPSQNIKDISQYANVITNAVRAAAAAKVGNNKPFDAVALAPALLTDNQLDTNLPLPKKLPDDRPPLILIGASTGGTEAVQKLLAGMEEGLPPVLITQHMPEGGFTAAFAKRLDGKTCLKVLEAEDRMPLEAGHAYVAPGGRHLFVKYISGRYFCQLSGAPPVSRHRPSVDCLFRSGLIAAGRNISAAILTGMGEDGVRALGEIRAAGGFTAAQNEATCVVYGMPRKAADAGAAEKILPPEEIAKQITKRYKS